MILDRLENAELYRPLGSKIALALDYLCRTDFSQVPNGRHQIDGDDVYVLVLRYRPKPLVEAMWEAHRQYVDVQYMAAGAERMGYAPLCNGMLVRTAYNPEQDGILYEAQGDFFEVRAGSFAIFTPHDVHAPGIASELADASAEVCKVVAKCRLGED
jgi:YhcH/YjgK/YiaL family protein